MRVRSCCVDGCAVSVTRHRLMCQRHWQMLPITLQVRLADAYQSKRCFQSRGFYLSVVEAVDFIARAEKRAPDPTNRYRHLAERMKVRPT